MKVDEVKHNSSMIRKTLLPVIFATRCWGCDSLYKWERMWTFFMGPFTFTPIGTMAGTTGYICLRCAKSKLEAYNIICEVSKKRAGKPPKAPSGINPK